MALGRGKTEHTGARDMARKHGFWGHADEAKKWASRARRRDEKRAVNDQLDAEVWATLADRSHDQIGGFADDPAPWLDSAHPHIGPPPLGRP